MNWKKFGREIGTYLIAGVVISGLFWMMARLFGAAIPPENEKILNLIAGFLIAKSGTVVDYYFGSSKGSADKTEAMTETK